MSSRGSTEATKCECDNADDRGVPLDHFDELWVELDRAEAEERAAGMVRGKVFFEWDEELKRLKREQKLEKALILAMQIIEATERQQVVEASHTELRARALGGEPEEHLPRETPPGWTEHAAIILRKLGRYDEEVAIIDRWQAHAGSPDRWVGAGHQKLLERRKKAAQLAESSRLVSSPSKKPKPVQERKQKERKPPVRMTMAPVEMLEQDAAATYRDLRALIDAEPNPERSWYLRWWAADALTLLQDHVGAVEAYPEVLGGRAVMQIERLWSLKLEADMAVTGREILALVGPNVTDFGRAHLPEVLRAMELLLEQDQASQAWPSLREWAVISSHVPYQVFIGSPAGYHASQGVTLQHYHFEQASAVVAVCADLIRRAENEVRRAAGLPFVGEGWVSETNLYQQVRAVFPDLDVIPHGSPDWLGRQHLDVWIPALRVGLEYQGEQHDRPIDFFGGEEGFVATQRRDERKRKLCHAHGVSLIEVRPGYELTEVLEKIEQKRSGVASED